MDQPYEWFVKMGPAWSLIFVFGSAAASAIFIIGNKQYKKLTIAAHAEQLRLKEDANTFLRERIAGLEVERNTYRENSHKNADRAHQLGLELAEQKTKPNVDSVISILQEFKNDLKENRKAQGEILTALENLNRKINAK